MKILHRASNPAGNPARMKTPPLARGPAPHFPRVIPPHCPFLYARSPVLVWPNPAPGLPGCYQILWMES
jgi:hypothetical protein